MNKPSRTANTDLLSIYIGVMELIDHGVIWLNKDGRIIGMNKQFCKNLGYEKEQFKPKTIFEINPYTHLISWRQFWDRLLTEKQVSFDSKHINANGLIYPVKMKGILVDTGAKAVCCGVVDKLYSKTPYKDLLKLTSRISKTGSWQWNLIDDSLVLTKEMHQFLNLPKDFSPSPEQFVRIIKQKLDKKTARLFFRRFKDSIQKGHRLDMELPILCNGKNDFNQFRIVGEPVFVDGRTLKFYGILQDISEVSNRTDELYLTQFAVDHALEIIFWIDNKGQFKYVNDRLSSALGFSRHELLAMKLSEIWPEWEPKKWRRQWKAMRGGEVLDLESAFLTREGQKLPVHLSANYINHRGEELICVFGRNITERKKKEQQLKQALEENKRLNEKLQEENEVLKDEIELEFSFNNIISKDPNLPSKR